MTKDLNILTQIQKDTKTQRTEIGCTERHTGNINKLLIKYVWMSKILKSFK